MKYCSCMIKEAQFELYNHVFQGISDAKTVHSALYYKTRFYNCGKFFPFILLIAR